MIYLILSIVTTASLFIGFKLFEKLKLNTFLAVVVNYITAASIGLFMNSYHGSIALTDQPWFFIAVSLGLIFITVFNLIGVTAQRLGVSVSSVANKMSLVIPFTIAVFLYGDRINFLKICGILLALFAVYFTSERKQQKDVEEGVIPAKNRSHLYLPFLLFLGSGILDALLNFSELMYLNEDTLHLFICVVFASAALIGLIVILIKRPTSERMGYTILAGIILGTVNYISIFSFLNALEIRSLQSSVIIPINNIGVVTVSALAAFIIFKEKLSAKNLIGLGLSIAAICLLNWS